MENVLQTYQLTKRYGNTAVVDGVSMRVPRGEIYGFVGRNGAGKTTVMRMICGLALKSGGGKKDDEKGIDAARRRKSGIWPVKAVRNP